MATNNLAARRAEIGRERRERTRKKLINAAARVIASQGEKNATIDDFIAEAGVARGTFYNYFPTREEMVDSLWAHVGKRPFQQVQSACAKLEDPAERLISVLRLIIGQAARDETWGWLIYSMSGADKVNEDLRAYPTPDLRAGLAAQRFQFTNIETARDMVVSTARTILIARLQKRASDQYVSEMCQMLLRALGLKTNEAARLSSRSLASLEPE